MIDGLLIGIVISIIWLTCGVFTIGIFKEVFDIEIYNPIKKCFIFVIDDENNWWLRLVIILSGTAGFALFAILLLIKSLIEIIRGC